jgi:hypothetical protein
VHLPCSLLWHLGWSWTWGRAASSPTDQRCRRSVLFASTGRSCCSTVGSLSRPTIFVKNPSFVRSSVHPSVYTKIARFCNLPRSCSIYKPCFSTTHCQCVLLSFAKRCLLLSLAGPLSHVVTMAHGPGPPATATATHRGCRMCVDPKSNGAHPGSLAASRVRGALIIRAWRYA